VNTILFKIFRQCVLTKIFFVQMCGKNNVLFMIKKKNYFFSFGTSFAYCSYTCRHTLCNNFQQVNYKFNNIQNIQVQYNMGTVNWKRNTFICSINRSSNNTRDLLKKYIILVLVNAQIPAF